MKKYRLYTEMAKYYDQFNSMHDVSYKKEVEFIRQMIKRYKHTEGTTILDVACGTGTYDSLLKRYFRITALDSSRDMLAVAKKKVKDVSFKLGKMQNFNLHKKFDVILCRGAMDYNFSYREVEKTLKNFNQHLKVGGIILFTFEAAKESFKPIKLGIRTGLDGNTKVIEASSSHAIPGKEFFEWNDFYFVINGGRVRILREPHHKQGLFEVKKVKKLLERLGFKVVVYSDFTKKLWSRPYGTKPIYIGIKTAG